MGEGHTRRARLDWRFTQKESVISREIAIWVRTPTIAREILISIRIGGSVATATCQNRKLSAGGWRVCHKRKPSLPKKEAEPAIKGSHAWDRPEG